MILVTGASGLLGYSLAREALATHRKVAAIHHRHPFCMPRAEGYCLDLTDFAESRKLINHLLPTSIIHCAAATNVDWCEDHPEEARAINVSASAHLAKLAREIGASFVYVSTDSVFDGLRGDYSENDAPKPVNVYAQSKLQAEREILTADPSALIARVTFYGWNPHNKPSLAEWILGRLRDGATVPGFTDVFFCPILANDLSGVLLQMLHRQLHGIYHVVGSERVSKFDFAVRLATAFGFDPVLVIPSSIEHANMRAARPRDTSLSTTKISQVLGRPMPDVDSGLLRFRALRESVGALELQNCIAGGNI